MTMQQCPMNNVTIDYISEDTINATDLFIYLTNFIVSVIDKAIFSTSSDVTDLTEIIVCNLILTVIVSSEY